MLVMARRWYRSSVFHGATGIQKVENGKKEGEAEKERRKRITEVGNLFHSLRVASSMSTIPLRPRSAGTFCTKCGH